VRAHTRTWEAATSAPIPPRRSPSSADRTRC